MGVSVSATIVTRSVPAAVTTNVSATVKQCRFVMLPTSLCRTAARFHAIDASCDGYIVIVRLLKTPEGVFRGCKTLGNTLLQGKTEGGGCERPPGATGNIPSFRESDNGSASIILLAILLGSVSANVSPAVEGGR